MFTAKDLEQIASKGTTPANVQKQLDYFRSGFPFLKIDRAATSGDGIINMDREMAARWAALYDRSSTDLAIEKFVPASGAATRMFKELYEYVNDGKSSGVVDKVLAGIRSFAFYDDLVALGIDMNDPKAVISAIIEQGLGYGKQPKGLIKFHNTTTGGRTALEEHLVEVALYGGTPSKIHFTVSPEHRSGFEAVVEAKRNEYEKQYGVEYRISYSVQQPSTDTIAVDMNNEPFRMADGSLLFRPAGHGALINNLDGIDADVIFIKTIDNVVPDHLKSDTVLYKKAIAAVALDVQQQTFSYIKQLNESRGDLAQIQAFIQDKLNYRFPSEVTPTSADLLAVLNRPIRVCGMVRNEGEPGGGPFWAVGSDGSQSLQIAESSQISPEQIGLMKSATHFNPVDLVCVVRDYTGAKFDLSKYVDPQTGFISTKSMAGRDLKAQELPGLWNGAMANWNTIFVEVPISTFAPVKGVVDLLRPQHQ